MKQALGTKTLHQGKSVLFIDIEMTGDFSKKSRNAHIIELAMKLITMIDTEFESVQEFNQMFKPDKPVNSYVEKITGITNEMLVDKPMLFRYVETIQNFVDKADIIVVHGGKLDTAALSQNGIKLNGKLIFDTATFAKQLYPTLTKTNLTFLSEYFELTFDSAHRAMGDVEGMINLYRLLTDMTAEEWTNLQHLRKKIKSGFTYAYNGI